MELGDQQVASAIDALVVDLRGLVKLLDDRPIADAVGLVATAQEFERFRHLLSLVDHRLIVALEESNAAERFGQRTVARVLSSALRISPGEAARRVAAAAAVGPRTSMLGEAMEPVRPLLADAQSAGEVSTEQVGIIVKALGSVDRRGFDPAAITAGEQILVDAARQMGPQDLARVAVRVVEAIDPDGTIPDERLQDDRRSLEWRRGKDGCLVGEFRLTPACGAKFLALLAPLARPVLPPRDTEDAELTAAGRLLSDERSRPQRMHDALEKICDRLLRGEVTDAGGVPATVIITIDAGKLADSTGHGVTSDGALMPARRVREIADNAEIWVAKLAPSGAVLELGRTRRIASRAQSIALSAREGGCSFPGCDVPPEWCERHHIKEWADGGATDLDNLTLVCRYHHRHFQQNGWRCQLNTDRLPEWIPPAWIDRQRRPRINQRIRAMNGGLCQ